MIFIILILLLITGCEENHYHISCPDGYKITGMATDRTNSTNLEVVHATDIDINCIKE